MLRKYIFINCARVWGFSIIIIIVNNNTFLTAVLNYSGSSAFRNIVSNITNTVITHPFKKKTTGKVLISLTKQINLSAEVTDQIVEEQDNIHTLLFQIDCVH